MLALLLTSLLMHPVHETYTEVEWNRRTNRLEVAMRLGPLDEQRLRGELANKREDSKWVIDYLRQTFRVDKAKTRKDQDGLVTYHWVGRENKRSHVWWYFEIEPADRQRPNWMEHRVLFDRNDHQLNRVLILGQVPKRALTLTIRQPHASLYQEQENDERVEQTESDR